MSNITTKLLMLGTGLFVGSVCAYFGIEKGKTLQKKEDIEKINYVISYFQDKMRPNENPGRTGAEQREFSQFNDGLRAGIDAINDSSSTKYLQGLEKTLMDQAKYESPIKPQKEQILFPITF